MGKIKKEVKALEWRKKWKEKFFFFILHYRPIFSFNIIDAQE
jgi:hypothetical protein